MRRLLALTAALCIAAVLLPAAGDAARVHYKTGISDQNPATFASPLYTSLHMSVARYITPWDVMFEKPRSYDRVQLDQWIAGARHDGQDILIAFEHSHLRGHERKVPKRRTYAKALKLFHRAYPNVRSISAWNEANRCQRVSKTSGAVLGQPICHNPKAAAGFYETARSVFKRDRVVALDILDQNSVRSSVRYVQRFLHYVRHFPRIWGIHDYSDTNRFSTKRTRALLRATRRGEVWLTETGGIVRFGHSFPFNPKRAARAIGCAFWIANHERRIKRVYLYQFNAGGRSFDFDAGLIALNGKKRPGWTVARKRAARRCRR